MTSIPKRNDLGARLERLERAVRDLSRSNVLPPPAPPGPPGPIEGTTIDASVEMTAPLATFDELAVTGDAAVGGTLDAATVEAATVTVSTALTAPLGTLGRLILTQWLTPVVVAGPTDNFDTSTTEADVPQLTTTITSPGTWARYRVTVDLAVGSFGNGTFFGYLNVGGTNLARPIVTAAPATGNRQQASRTYIVTGLAAGNHVFKVRARSSVASPDNHRMYAGQCTLTITQIL